MPTTVVLVEDGVALANIAIMVPAHVAEANPSVMELVSISTLTATTAVSAVNSADRTRPAPTEIVSARVANRVATMPVLILALIERTVVAAGETVVLINIAPMVPVLVMVERPIVVASVKT